MRRVLQRSGRIDQGAVLEADQLRAGGGLLSLITTITSFATAADVTVSELRLEAFLPADEPTAAALRDSAKLDP